MKYVVGFSQNKPTVESLQYSKYLGVPHAVVRWAMLGDSGPLGYLGLL